MASISDNIITNLKLMGQRTYTAGMNAAAAAGERLGRANVAVETTAKKMGGQLNQSAFNMGNVLHMAGRLTFALGALAAAGAYVGIKFEASMEQSQVAFAELLNSTSAANQMLQKLFDLAAKTPFEFPQITQAAQKLLGFGMAADEVLPLLSKVGDAVAAVGADPERIDRITRALGQMQAKGKVYSEELLQLADAGLPAYQMLAEGLGVTGAKLNGMLRKGQVSAKKGLDILAKQMEKRYKGMAEKQSKTFNGLISTIRDYSRMILGFAVKPLFDYLEKKVLPAITKIETSIVKWGRSGGFKRFQKNLKVAFDQAQQKPGEKKKGLFTPDKQLGLAQKVGTKLGKIWKAVSGYFGDLMDALAPAKPFWDNVLGPFLKGIAVGAFGGFIAILKLAIPVLKIFATVLGWLGTKLKPLRKLFYWIGFAIGFIFGPGKIFNTAVKVLGVMGKFLGFLLLPFKLVMAIVGRASGVFRKFGLILADKLYPLVKPGSKLEGAILKLLETWEKFSKGLISGSDFIKQNISVVAGVFYLLGSEIAKQFWRGLKSQGSKVFNGLMGVFGGIVPGVAAANSLYQGSKGPDALAPLGPAVPPGGKPYSPLVNGGKGSKAGAWGAPTIGWNINNYTILDGKIVAKSVAKNTADKMAHR